MIKVSKFGGSSVADSTQFKKVKKIILKDKSRRFIVVSAIGKSDMADEKVTDLFIQLYNNPADEKIFNRICTKFLNIKKDLNLNFPIEEELNNIKNDIENHVSYDYLISRGEYLTAKLMAEYIQYPFIDAKDIIEFKNEESIDFERTEANINYYLSKFSNFIMPGFYGISKEKQIHLMKRGGSDISGALLARYVNADLYENWTDVSGFYMADPKVIKNPKKINVITYKELRALSHMGANVLHEEAIFPVKEKQIPIQILNTNYPKDSGTLILNQKTNGSYEISGIAGNKEYSIIRVFNQEEENEMDTIHDSLEILKKYKINIENIPTGINDFSLVVKNQDKIDGLQTAIQEMQNLASVEKIQLTNNVALISVVGQKLMNHSKTIGNIFMSLGNADIEVKVISKGIEDMNLLIGVDSSLLNVAVKSLYNALV